MSNDADFPVKKRTNSIVNDQTMKFDAKIPIELNPQKGIGLNSYFLTFRHNLESLRRLSMTERKDKLKRLFIKDFLEEQKDLNEVDLSYINTQP